MKWSDALQGIALESVNLQKLWSAGRCVPTGHFGRKAIRALSVPGQRKAAGCSHTAYVEISSG